MSGWTNCNAEYTSRTARISIRVFFCYCCCCWWWWWAEIIVYRHRRVGVYVIRYENPRKNIWILCVQKLSFFVNADQPKRKSMMMISIRKWFALAAQNFCLFFRVCALYVVSEQASEWVSACVHVLVCIYGCLFRFGEPISHTRVQRTHPGKCLRACEWVLCGWILHAYRQIAYHKISWRYCCRRRRGCRCLNRRRHCHRRWVVMFQSSFIPGQRNFHTNTHSNASFFVHFIAAAAAPPSPLRLAPVSLFFFLSKREHKLFIPFSVARFLLHSHTQYNTSHAL